MNRNSAIFFQQRFKRWLFVRIYYSQATLVQSIYFAIVSTTMTHPYKGTIAKLWFKERIHKIRLFEIFIYKATLDNAWIFLLAFLHSSEMWSSKESLWSNLTPNSLSLLLLVMSKFLFWQYYALSSVKIRQACSKVLLSINYFNRRLWNTFKNTFWWSSLLSNTSARRECDTSATRVWHEWDTSDTIAAQVLQKRHECDTGEKPLLKLLYGKWQITRRRTISF